MSNFNLVNFAEPSVIIDLILGVIAAVCAIFLVCKKINRLFVYCFYVIGFVLMVCGYIFDLRLVMNVSSIALLAGSILFLVINQSEYRKLLVRNTTLKSRKERMQKATTQDMYKMVAETVKSLSRTKTGAIITFEKETPLDSVIKNGTMLNAPVVSELLTTIFYPGTRLHDGAVVIRGNTILAASVYYSPSNKAQMGKVGSRHRAALGISEISDSVTVVVSEETGLISIAYKGNLEHTTYDSFLDDFTGYMEEKD